MMLMSDPSQVVELSESGHAPLDRRVKLAELLKDGRGAGATVVDGRR
jgi:hypothetical protein